MRTIHQSKSLLDSERRSVKMPAALKHHDGWRRLPQRTSGCAEFVAGSSSHYTLSHGANMEVFVKQATRQECMGATLELGALHLV